MDYTFKINEEDKERRLILKDEFMIYAIDGSVYEIPYNRISAVWLNKPGGICTPNHYSCTLNIDDDKPVFISSRNWGENGREIIQQNHYNSFIRVLHLHLKEKSKAQYGFGVKPKPYFMRVGAIVTILSLSVLFAIIFNLNNVLIAIPAVISVSVLTCGLNFCLKNFPSTYKPDCIPFALLPVQS